MVLDRLLRQSLLRFEASVQDLRGRWTIWKGKVCLWLPVSVVHILWVLLDRHRFWLGQELFCDVGVCGLRHRIFVEALLEEHFLLSERIAIDDHVVLCALGGLHLLSFKFKFKL